MVVESESYTVNIKLLEKALQRAEDWARRYAAKFAPEKFELLYFTNLGTKMDTEEEM